MSKVDRGRRPSRTGGVDAKRKATARAVRSKPDSATKSSLARLPSRSRKIVETIVGAIERGVVPWMQPWGHFPPAAASRADLQRSGVDHNYVTEQPYTGNNLYKLWRKRNDEGYQRCAWVTPRQAESLGTRVPSRGAWVRLCRPLEHGFDHFFVINVGLLECSVFEQDPEPEPLQAALQGSSSIRRAQEFVRRTGARIEAISRVRFGAFEAAEACYDVTYDCIYMPSLLKFRTTADYYATLLHELVHWSGHADRCNRLTRGTPGAYAREELIAELGSAFLCKALNIEGQVEQHAAYIQHWQQLLKRRRHELATAALRAYGAVMFLKKLAAAGEP